MFNSHLIECQVHLHASQLHSKYTKDITKENPLEAFSTSKSIQLSRIHAQDSSTEEKQLTLVNSFSMTSLLS